MSKKLSSVYSIFMINITIPYFFMVGSFLIMPQIVIISLDVNKIYSIQNKNFIDSHIIFFVEEKQTRYISLNDIDSVSLHIA